MPEDRRAIHRRRKSGISESERLAITVISIIGCAVAVFAAESSPTGFGVADAAYRCAFVIVCALAGSRARRWALVIATGLVAIGSTTWMLIPPVAAFVLAAVLAWENKRDRVLGAVVGTAVGWSALNLVWPTSTGATALLALVAVAPLWVSGYRVARSRSRRRIRVTLLVAAGVMVLGTAIAGVTLVTQRSVLQDAASQTIDAAAGITGGSTTESAKQFDAAASRFDSAANAVSAPWTHPARLVPVVAQNLKAVHVAASAGARVSRTAAELAGKVDYDELRRDGGGIDLAVLASFAEPVKAAGKAVEQVDDDLRALDSPWLVGPVRSNLEKFLGEVGPLRNGAKIAAVAVEAAPAMLGAEGERRYLLMLGNPAEARDMGGHIGSFAELRSSDGALDLVRVVSPYELFSPGAAIQPSLDIRGIPASMLEMNPTRFPQNWGASPDLAVVANVARQLYPQSAGGAAIDGVIYADPFAFAALLDIVGSVDLTEEQTPATGPVTISATNAVQFLTRTQFQNPESGPDPAKVLVETSLDRFTSNQLPSISAIADAFHKPVNQGHLQFTSFHSGDMELLDLVGLDPRFGRPEGGDLLAVINSNAHASKIDAYLKRSIDYQIAWNPDSGRVNTRVDVVLENTAPTTGLPSVVGRSPQGSAAGTNRTVLSVITPLRATDVSIGEDRVPFGTRPDVDGLLRHSVMVDIAPGAKKSISFDLTGEVAPGSDYQIVFFNQPLVNRDRAQIGIRSTGAPFRGGSQTGTVPIDYEHVTNLRLRTEG